MISHDRRNTSSASIQRNLPLLDLAHAAIDLDGPRRLVVILAAFVFGFVVSFKAVQQPVDELPALGF